MIISSVSFSSTYNTKRLLEELKTEGNTTKHSRLPTAENSMFSGSRSMLSTPVAGSRNRKKSCTLNEILATTDPFRTMDVSMSFAHPEKQSRPPSASPLSKTSLTPNHFMHEVLDNQHRTPKDKHKRSLMRPSNSAYNALYCGYKLGKPVPFHDPSKVFRVFFQSRPANCSTLQIPKVQTVPHSASPNPSKLATLEGKLEALSRAYLTHHQFDPEALKQVRSLYECIRKREVKFTSCRANSVLHIDGQMQAIAEFMVKYAKKLGVKDAVFVKDATKRETLARFERFLLHLQRDVFL